MASTHESRPAGLPAAPVRRHLGLEPVSGSGAQRLAGVIDPFRRFTVGRG
jgi:hypothetical protein